MALRASHARNPLSLSCDIALPIARAGRAAVRACLLPATTMAPKKAGGAANDKKAQDKAKAAAKAKAGRSGIRVCLMWLWLCGCVACAAGSGGLAACCAPPPRPAPPCTPPTVRPAACCLLHPPQAAEDKTFGLKNKNKSKAWVQHGRIAAAAGALRAVPPALPLLITPLPLPALRSVQQHVAQLTQHVKPAQKPVQKVRRGVQSRQGVLHNAA